MKPIRRAIANVLTARLPQTYRLILLYNYLTTDIYIFSFPKSGRTWLRMMLAKIFNLMQGRDAIGDFVDAAKYVRADGKKIKITFEHEDSRGTPYYALETNKKRNKKKKVIFLARDPRDVMVSYYFEMTKRKGLQCPDISSFIRDERYGIDTVIRYMNIWMHNKDRPADFLLLFYEEMQASPSRQLERVLHFIGLKNISRALIDDAVAFSRFDNMQKIEGRGILHTPEMTPADRADAESFKTRKGKIGGYADYFSSEDTLFMNSKIKEHLSSDFGYAKG